MVIHVSFRHPSILSDCFFPRLSQGVSCSLPSTVCLILYECSISLCKSHVLKICNITMTSVLLGGLPFPTRRPMKNKCIINYVYLMYLMM